MRRGLVTCLLTVVAALASASPAQALFLIQVNVKGDASDIDLNTDVCDTSPASGNQCTLRGAIEQANENGFGDISFGFPDAEVNTIKPQTPLPLITAQVNFRGYDTVGASPNTKPFGKPLDTQIKVFIDGRDTEGTGGLRFGEGSEDSEVHGLAIAGFDQSAIAAVANVNVIVQGNFLGTNAAGTNEKFVSSGFFGGGGSGSVIGGGAPADRNLIAGADNAAISSNGFVTIEGNYIGVAADAKSPLTNSSGIRLLDPNDGSIVVENIIAHTEGTAVETSNNDPGTLISFNRIFDNAGLGIDIHSDGITPNDIDESDGFQNLPEVQSAERVSDGTQISGVLSSLPSTQYTIELYEADGKDREGKRLLDQVNVNTDGEGTGLFELTVSKKLKKGKFVTATATNPLLGTSGDTSEFAKPRKVK